MQQDTVQGVHDSHQVSGLQKGRQSSWVLPFIVKYAGSTVRGENEEKKITGGISYQTNSLLSEIITDIIL